MDEHLRYVQDQLAAGKSAEEIKASLRANGWQDAQINELFGKLSPSAPEPLPVETTNALPVAAEPTNTQPPTGFNWGAFWLTWIWGLGHGLWLSALLIPLTIITSLFSLLASIASLFAGFLKAIFGVSSVNYGLFAFIIVAVVNLAIAYWFGRKGNAWAWSRRGNRDAAVATKREKVWGIVGWIFGILIIINWIFVFSGLLTAKTSSINCAEGVTLTVNGTDKCQTTVATTTFTATSFSFDYPSTWTPKKMCELLENCSGDSAGDQTLFFTPEELTKTNQAIADFKANPKADFGSFFALVAQFQNELAVNYTANQTSADCTPGVSIIDENGKDMCAAGYTPPATDAAKTAAEGLTQNVCHGSDSSYSSSNPTRPELVETITVAGKTAYGVKKEADCSTKSYTIYMSTSEGYFDLTLSGINAFADVTTIQKNLLNSLKTS